MPAHRRRGPVVALAACAVTAAVAGPARGEDARVQAAVTDGVPQVEATVRRSDDRDPAGAQAIYDAARDLDERLRAAAGVSPRCRPLLDAARVYATARVTQAEAMDRPAYTSSTPARLRAEAARARVQSLAGSCADRGRGPGAAPWTMTPRSDEAFFGTVVARVPARAVTAVVRVDGGEHGRVVVGDGGVGALARLRTRRTAHP